MLETMSDGPAPDRPVALRVAEYCQDSSFARRLFGDGATTTSLLKGQTLFRQGDPGDTLYLLLEGRLIVRLRHPDGTEIVLAQLEPGALLGELALLTGGQRSASIAADTDAELVACSRATFEELAEEHPDELADFIRAVTHRIQEVQLAKVLTELFGRLDAETVSWLREELEWIHLGHGEALFRSGDSSDGMYVLVSGRLRVTVTRPQDGQQVVGEVSPGEPVGELGLLSGEPRSATVVSIRETNVVKMTESVFQRLASRQPAAVTNLTRPIITRQQRSLRSAAAPVRALALALVPAGPDVPLVSFAARLADALRADGPVLVLDGARLDEALRRPGAAQEDADGPTGLVVSAWLSEQEKRFRYLVYVADPHWSPWTERCVCQGDRLLVIADARARPGLGPVERAIRERKVPARQELVLLHPQAAARPSGTGEWISSRCLHAHHHVRIGDRAHMERLARRVAGKAVGLVLSGGGARGFAHVGVIRALEELGTSIDIVGGTSMGALIGGLHAVGHGPQDIAEIAARLANPKRMFDYTLPIASLLASAKLTQIMREMYGEAQIEDLWRTYFCVSANLTRAERVVHRSGALWKAVRTSVAVPGIWTPMVHGDDVLVDGGALSNFPVDVMVQLCEGGTVIGSDLPGRPAVSGQYDFGPSVSGWKILWSRINPFRPPIRVPSLAATVWRAHEISGASEARRNQAMADLLVQPDVGAFSLMDYESYKPIIEIGYQAAREKAAEWMSSR
jgi:predicted acylesterase/phospholipase RssA/CRP-like cAMP-binding protein